MSDRVSRLQEGPSNARELLRRALKTEGDRTIRPRKPTVVEPPLSRSQEAVWFMSRMAPDSPFLNLPSAISLRGPLDADALIRALQTITARHEVLRTRFPDRAGKPFQQIQSALVPDIARLDVSDADDPEQSAFEAAGDLGRAPFDIAGGPLWRGALIRLGPEEHHLVLVYHHLVWDGWSIGVFARELAALYSAYKDDRTAPLPGVSLQFADYAVWERETLSGTVLQDRLAWWREQLGGVPELELPLDRPRPTTPTFPGAMVGVTLDEALSQQVEALRGTTGASLYQILLAAFGALLVRCSGQDHFALGTPAANRLHPEVEGLMGPLANILVLPVDARRDPTFRELVARVRSVATGAFARQEVPFETLVEHLGVERHASRNPLFQVMFALHAELMGDTPLADLTVGTAPVPAETTHFDLGLHLWNRTDGIQGYFSFNSELFDAATLERMAGRFAALLASAVADPDCPLSELSVLEPAEAEQLAAWASREPAGDSLLDALPRDPTWERAEALAGWLVAQGWDRMAVTTTGADRDVAWLAALRAGIPLDPAAPHRLDHVDPGWTGTPPSLPGPDTLAVAPATRHADLAADVAALQSALPLQPGDRLVGPAHPGALVTECLWPRIAGASFVAADSPLDALPPAGALHLAPSELEHLARTCPTAHLAALGALRGILVTGGPLPTRVVADASQRVRCPLVHGYAPPETGRVVAVGPAARTPWPLVPAGVPHAPVQVVDRTGQPCPVGIPGRVVVGGVPTGDRGRFEASGSLALTGSVPGTAWLAGTRIDLEDLARTVETEPRIQSVHVQARAADDGVHLVLWVVPRRALPDSALPVPELGVPTHVCRVSHLPLTADGAVDDEALARLPVVDDALASRLEEGLAQIPGVAEVAVRTRPRAHAEPALHLSALVPELWEARTRKRSTAAAADERVAPDLPGPKAHVVGPPVPFPADAPATATQALVQLAASPRGAEHFVVTIDHDGSEQRTTWTALHAAALRVLGGLRAAGLGPGDRAILQVASLHQHLPVFWGCVYAGVVPVAVALPHTFDEENAVLEKLRAVHATLDAPAVIGSPSHPLATLDPAVLLAAEPATEPHPAAADDDLFLQLTSGSTGASKAIRIRHGGVVQHAFSVGAHNGYGPQDVTLNWLPMDHVMSILTAHLRDCVLGASEVHAHPSWLLAEPLRLLDLIERFGCTQAAAPNFLYRLLHQGMAATTKTWDLSSVRWFLNGGEQVLLEDVTAFMDRVTAMGARPESMQPAFGMAESCTGVAYTQGFDVDRLGWDVAASSIEEQLRTAEDGERSVFFVDLGPPVPGIEIRIADDAGQVMPECVIGRLQLKGAVVTPGYLDAEANAEAFVGDGWFDTGDLGFLRDGRLTVTGRRKETIVVRGANFHCYEIEEFVGRLDGVAATWVGAVAVEDTKGGGLGLFYVPERAADLDLDLVRTVRTEVARHFGIVPTRVVPLDREAFPRTTSGKVQRAKLQKALAAGTYDPLLVRIDLALDAPDAVPAWFWRWQWVPCAPSTAASPPPTEVLVDPTPEALRQAALELDQAVTRLIVVAPGWASGTRHQPGPLRGLLATLALEKPGLDVRLVDPGAQAADAIEVERHSLRSEPVVAWKDGVRHALRLEPVRPSAQLPDRGTVLVSGGLGAIGRALSSALVELGYDVLAVGRTAPSTPAPAGVRIALASVSDPEALRQAVQGETLIGAFHLAGHWEPRALTELDADGLERALDAKVHGALALDAVLPEGAFLVGTGSLGGDFGVAGAPGYAAASSGLAAVCAWRRAQGRPTVHVSSSTWDGVGMSADLAAVEQVRALGYAKVDPTRGIASLLAALGTLGSEAPEADPVTSSALLVGLDGTAPNAARFRAGPVQPARAPVAWWAPAEPTATLPAIPMPDAFGRPVRWTAHRVDALPRTASGAVDDRGLVSGPARARKEPVLPRTGLERTIAAVWADVLELDQVDVDETFFALGGQSVTLIQVAARLETSLGRPIPVVDLFRYPTVRALADHLGAEPEPDRAKFDKVAERAAKQRRARRRVKRPTRRNRR